MHLFIEVATKEGGWAICYGGEIGGCCMFFVAFPPHLEDGTHQGPYLGVFGGPVLLVGNVAFWLL